jgi:uncharacterized YigZ family protein
MNLPYLVPGQETAIELQVLNSRFIAVAARVGTVAEAKAFIHRIRQEHPKAHHHVYAFVVGFGSSVIEGCHDDGEPSGTAGRPVLAVLRGSGLGDTVVVVTRYFGGTKLGTGGLVRAYGDAARQVLEDLPRVEKVEWKHVHLTVPYSHYELVQRLVSEHRGKIVAEDFAAEVALDLEFGASDLPQFAQSLSEATAGRLGVA